MRSQFIKTFFNKVDYIPSEFRAEVLINAFVMLFGELTLSDCSFKFQQVFPHSPNRMEFKKVVRDTSSNCHCRYATLNEFINDLYKSDYCGNLKLNFIVNSSSNLKDGGSNIPTMACIDIHIEKFISLSSVRVFVNKDRITYSGQSFIDYISNHNANSPNELFGKIATNSLIMSTNESRALSDVESIVTKYKNNEYISDEEVSSFISYAGSLSISRHVISKLNIITGDTKEEVMDVVKELVLHIQGVDKS